MPVIKTQASGSKTSSGIEVLRAFVILAMAGAAILLAFSIFRVVTSDSLVSPLDLEIPTESISAPYPASATIVDASAGVVVDAGFGYRLAWWFVTDALAVVVIGFLELLRRILANPGDPFTDQNATRLRRMSILALVFACVSLIRPIVSVAIQDNAGFDGFEATWDFSGLFVFLALTALLEVWRHGVALQSDHELTI